MSGIRIITSTIAIWTIKDNAAVHGLFVLCGFALEMTRTSNIATSLQLPPRACRLRILHLRQFLVPYTYPTAPQLVPQFRNWSMYLPQLPLPWQNRTLEEPLRPLGIKPGRSRK